MSEKITKAENTNDRIQRKIIGYIVMPFYLIFFFGILVVFDPILRLSKFTSPLLFHKLLEVMNFLIILNLKYTNGTNFTFKSNLKEEPVKLPIIFVANHQSMYDIPLIIWFLRIYKPLFIAKKELSRYIPSISYSLRNMGSLIIDRGGNSKTISAIAGWSRELANKNGCVTIFPEGTRARDGILKQFKPGGLITLIENMPQATIIPLVIENSWQLVRYNLCPVPYGISVKLTALEAIEKGDKSNADLVKDIEKVFQQHFLNHTT